MLSPEVQSAVDEIRRNKSLTKSLQAERDLWKSKAMSLQEALDKAATSSSLSSADRDALKQEIGELDALNDELEGAAQANTGNLVGGDDSAIDPKNAPIPPVGAEGHPTEPLTSGDVLNANGPANHPAGGTQPLMPNMAFDPDPTKARGAGDAGQPNQAPAIETVGGFVVTGGGSVQRAPGSDPASPSSSAAVPDEAVAAAAVPDEPKPETAPVPAPSPEGQPVSAAPIPDDPAAPAPSTPVPTPVDETKPNAPALP